MWLKILLPYGIFADEKEITRIVAETTEGSFGILPRRLDCVAALNPGILVYETKSGGETFVAIDEGVLVKTGLNVHVSVRSAVSGKDLSALRNLVENEFVHLNEEHSRVKSVLNKMEEGLLSRLSEFRHE